MSLYIIDKMWLFATTSKTLPTSDNSIIWRNSRKRPQLYAKQWTTRHLTAFLGRQFFSNKRKNLQNSMNSWGKQWEQKPPRPITNDSSPRYLWTSMRFILSRIITDKVKGPITTTAPVMSQELFLKVNLEKVCFRTQPATSNTKDWTKRWKRTKGSLSSCAKQKATLPRKKRIISKMSTPNHLLT